MIGDVCPYCGSDDTQYLGIDEGAGYYADEMCEMFECLSCGEEFIGDCMPFEVGEEEE